MNGPRDIPRLPADAALEVSLDTRIHPGDAIEIERRLD